MFSAVSFLRPTLTENTKSSRSPTTSYQGKDSRLLQNKNSEQ